MLLKPLRAWLNGRRDYFTGVAIYSQHNPDKNLLPVLKVGPNEFRVKRLLEELLLIYNELTEAGCETPKASPQPPDKNRETRSVQNSENASIVSKTPASVSKTPEKYSTKEPKNIPEAKPVNEELYLACKEEADNQYKKVMDKRAVLFHKARPDGYLDINKPDLMFDRGELAIEILQGWKKVDELYERAKFVKLQGRLPASSGEDEEDTEYDHLPDTLVKQQLDNARKAYNKLKKKQPTPERIALMQKHEANIKKLTEKWDLLQPKQ